VAQFTSTTVESEISFHDFLISQSHVFGFLTITAVFFFSFSSNASGIGIATFKGFENSTQSFTTHVEVLSFVDQAILITLLTFAFHFPNFHKSHSTASDKSDHVHSSATIEIDQDHQVTSVHSSINILISQIFSQFSQTISFLDNFFSVVAHCQISDSQVLSTSATEIIS